MKMMMSLSFLLLCICCLAAAEPQFHRVQNIHKAARFYQDFIIDDDARYIMVTTPGSKMFRASINFHDLASGYSVVKDIGKGICYLEPSNHTLDNFKQRVTELQNEANPSGLKQFAWSCSKSPMPKQLVYGVAGDRIGRFCDEYTTMFVTRHAQENTNLLKRDDEPTEYGCGFCVLAWC